MVTEKFTDKAGIPKPLKFRRVKQNIPEFLSRLTTGKEVLDLVMGGYAFSMDHDELRSQEEVDLVGGFFNTVRDWGDLGDDLEPRDRVSTAYDLTQTLQELEEAGFFVFGGREVQLMEGGIQTEPSNWPISIFKVLRKDNEKIIHVNLDAMKQKDVQQLFGRGARARTASCAEHLARFVRPRADSRGRTKSFKPFALGLGE